MVWLKVAICLANCGFGFLFVVLVLGAGNKGISWDLPTVPIHQLSVRNARAIKCPLLPVGSSRLCCA